MRTTITPLASLLGCALLALVLCSAAKPFERVDLQDQAYTDFATVSAADLLSGYDLPLDPISRLEAALLASRALSAYGAGLLAGADRSKDVEDALGNLSSEFADELAQLGQNSGVDAFEKLVQQPAEEETQSAADDSTTYRAPAPPKADALPPQKCGPGSSGGACKITPREEARHEDEAAADQADSEPEQGEQNEGAAEAEGGAAAEDAVTVSMYGCAQVQLQAGSTKLAPTGSDSLSNVDVYYSELGWDAGYQDWNGHFSVNLNDEEGSVDLYEAYVTYHNHENGTTFHLGRYILPFSNNFFYTPVFPATNDLGATTANGISVGTEKGSWALGAYLFKPDVETADKTNGLTEYSVVWDISKHDAAECSPGWKLTAGYSSDLAAHDSRLAGEGPLEGTVSACNLYGKYDWDGSEDVPGGRWHAIAEYTAALDEYAPADLDANGDGIGDKPSALNVELINEPQTDQLFGVTYQSTSQMADYADKRYGLLYGERINKLVFMKLLASHGDYGSYATGGQQSDNNFTGELCFNF